MAANTGAAIGVNPAEAVASSMKDFAAGGNMTRYRLVSGVARYKVMFTEDPNFPASGTAMRAVFIALLLIGAAAPPAHGQAADNNKGSVQGSVVDSKTGQPLKGAEVSLRSLSAGPRGEPGAAVTDTDGHFVIDHLPQGRYRVVASHTGYLSRDPRFGGGMRTGLISLSSGQRAEGIVLRLIPSAVITGRVAGENDQPLPNVFVEAMKYVYQGDKRQLSDAGSSTTDDRGEYRIWNLPPGKYYVRATHPHGKAPRQGQAYVPVFYPGVTDLSRTQTIYIRPGDEVSGIDLSFTPVHAVRISGRVVTANSLPVKAAQVTLVGGGGSMTYTVAQKSADAKGAFEIKGVPSGSYTLIAEQFSDSEKTLRGRTSVEVGEVEVSGLEVVIGPGASVSGQVKIESKTVSDSARVPDLAKLTVALDSQDDLSSMGFAPDVSNVAVRADGTFLFQNVPEGTYHVKVLPVPDGYYLKPAGEGDAVESGLKVGRNHARAVELTLSTGAGRISGTVVKEQQPFAGASVVLIPDAPRRGQARLYRLGITDSGGKFNISSIPPGEYKLFAWEEIERGMFLDPEFMQSYEGSGKAVHVEEGSTQSVQLDLIPATE